VGTDAETEWGYSQGCMDCTLRESLGTKFLEASAPSKQTPPFLTLYAETRFWHFKEPAPFKKIQKTSAILCEVETVSLVQYIPSFFSGLTFIKRIMIIIYGLEREQEFSHETKV
jgi:hypothetical protein